MIFFSDVVEAAFSTVLFHNIISCYMPCCLPPFIADIKVIMIFPVAVTNFQPLTAAPHYTAGLHGQVVITTHLDAAIASALEASTNANNAAASAIEAANNAAASSLEAIKQLQEGQKQLQEGQQNQGRVNEDVSRRLSTSEKSLSTIQKQMKEMQKFDREGATLFGSEVSVVGSVPEEGLLGGGISGDEAGGPSLVHNVRQCMEYLSSEFCILFPAFHFNLSFCSQLIFILVLSLSKR